MEALKSPAVDSPPSPLLMARTSLEEAKRLRAAGQPQQAEKICETLLQRYPDYVGALEMVALALVDQQKFGEAVQHLVRAVAIGPRVPSTLANLGEVYLQLGASVMARRTLEKALQYKPDYANVLTMLGEIYARDQEYEAGADAFRKALSHDGSLDAARLGLGICLNELGAFGEAAEAFQEIFQRHPGSIDVLFLLAQIPSGSVTADLLPQVDRASPGAWSDPKLFTAKQALTRAILLDRAGRYGEAWEAAVMGNRSVVDTKREAYLADRQAREAFMVSLGGGAAKPGLIHAADESHPISLFILGLSRSGKSTCERLVSSLGGVKLGRESQIIPTVVSTAFQEAGLPTRDAIVHLLPELEDRCRALYLAELRERAGPAKLFTNTNLGHISGALRIAEVLPNTRFVFIRRNRQDVALRIFMQLYDVGNPHAYDPATIREYLDWYDRMIQIMADRLAPVCAVVDYEDMVADPEGTLRALAELCGLPPPTSRPPPLGDDRGCAEPYRRFLQAS